MSSIARTDFVAGHETFSRNANGVRAISGAPAFAPTPLALRLNVAHLKIPIRELYLRGQSIESPPL